MAPYCPWLAVIRLSDEMIEGSWHAQFPKARYVGEPDFVSKLSFLFGNDDHAPVAPERT
jgi:hypothetical protein